MHPAGRCVSLDQGATQDAVLPVSDRVLEPGDDVVVRWVVEVLPDPLGGSAEAVECPDAFGVDGARVPVVKVVDCVKRSLEVCRSEIVTGTTGESECVRSMPAPGQSLLFISCRGSFLFRR